MLGLCQALDTYYWFSQSLKVFPVWLQLQQALERAKTGQLWNVCLLSPRVRMSFLDAQGFGRQLSIPGGGLCRDEDSLRF